MKCPMPVLEEVWMSLSPESLSWVRTGTDESISHFDVSPRLLTRTDVTENLFAHSEALYVKISLLKIG